ncbi:uncharacterized protein SPSK_04006 [Sporothrix schenckii 1099-18]|uniref:Zn(2)-C6 fungal-type domain-containing protein n=2 Tax=Sporothrix schenckii TaxID=29908 RepID=U7PV48_SPOS1|nr:uncharacterized protein SPSK_04006 [Sporothrix schenckii 1099-18]ERS98826.1 hypothetical protein HMPREF1624_04016 [Sporothrix schenckii ATCC 58251]KJR83572.1 hypothetical protein SPSK_04006 [Sporothrix schenckii 1099-18]
MSSSYTSPGAVEVHGHGHGLAHSFSHNLGHGQQQQQQQQQQHAHAHAHAHNTTSPVAYYSGHTSQGYAPVVADPVLTSPYSVAATTPSATATTTSTSPPSLLLPPPPPPSVPVMRPPQHMSSSPSPSASSADPSLPLPPPSSAASTTATKRRLPRAAATYPRKRATQACLTCRFRRTKCDNARPACAACVRLGADCSYREADHSTFDPASLTILNRLDDLERLFRERSAGTAPAVPGPPMVQTIPPNAVNGHGHGHGHGHGRSLDATSPASQISQAQSDLSYAVDVWSRDKRPQVSIDAVLQWAPLKDEGFTTRMFPSPRRDDATSPEANGALSNGNGSNWRGAIDLDLPAADAVLRSFFDNVHVFNPILEEEDVQDYVKMVRFQGIGWDAVSCLTLLIYALGTACTTFGRDYAGEVGLPSAFRQSPEFHEAEAYFVAAQKRMGMLLCRSGVIDAQCFFLAGVYLMTTLRPVEAWKMFVQALACCQGFLVPDTEEGPATSPATEAAAGAGAAAASVVAGTEDGSNPKRRIYWACYKSELELRLELNPYQKDVWDLTYPTFFPSPPDALKARDETAWYFYLAEIALTRLKNRILSHLYQSDTHATRESNIEYILDFEEQIQAWLGSLPPPLELTALYGGGDGDGDGDGDGGGAAAAEDRRRDQNEAFRYVLNGHLLDCKEIMYWPFVVDAVHGRSTTATAASKSRSYTAAGRHHFASFVRKGLRVCVDRIRQSHQGFRHRHHGTWLMLRSSTRSALVLLAVARCPSLASQGPHGLQGLDQTLPAVPSLPTRPILPAGWDDRVADVADMLQLWQDESSDVRAMLTAVEALLRTSPMRTA